MYNQYVYLRKHNQKCHWFAGRKVKDNKTETWMSSVDEATISSELATALEINVDVISCESPLQSAGDAGAERARRARLGARAQGFCDPAVPGSRHRAAASDAGIAFHFILESIQSVT